MRKEIINALLHKGTDAIKHNEVLLATDEEIDFAFLQTDPEKNKTRYILLKREKQLRNAPEEKCLFGKESEKEQFRQEWNRVVKMFK